MANPILFVSQVGFFILFLVYFILYFSSLSFLHLPFVVVKICMKGIVAAEVSE